ncbi:MAG: hypothetical protein V9G14_07805 [Cypionkella sp.]
MTAPSLQSTAEELSRIRAELNRLAQREAELQRLMAGDMAIPQAPRPGWPIRREVALH